MIDIQNVLYSNRDVYFKPRLSTMRVINSITIDMTGWAENENKNAEGIYSYSATFIDDNSCKQTAVCTGMKSGGMQKLLTELRHRFRNNIVIRTSHLQKLFLADDLAEHRKPEVDARKRIVLALLGVHPQDHKL